MSEEKQSWLRGFEWIIVLLLLVPASFLIGEQRGTRKALENAEVVRDTVVTYLWDTVFQDRPVYVDRIKVRTEYVPVTDTLRIHDTTFVEVPIEQVEYRDTLYRAWVSGYHPALDSIQIFQQTKIVEVTKTITEKPKRWGIGIQAGYGVTVHQGTLYASPYIGVGVSYNFIRW